MAATAFEQGATLINYMPVTAINKDGDGVATGVTVRNDETGEELSVDGRVIINATGPFSDAVRKLDNPDANPIIAPSQGVHLVLDRSFIAGESAIMVPHTSDGRVMFAIPWHDVAVVGTTDTPIDEVSLEPRAFEEEIDYILETANRYLDHPATREDILSVFAGIRPLVKAGDTGDTAALSREHAILVDPDSGLLTAAGGKWTTYRKMAEDIVDNAVVLAGLEPVDCTTSHLQIHGYHQRPERFGRFDFYGSDAAEVENLTQSDPAYGERVHPELELTAGEVAWFCRREMARTVDDVLARRSRSLLFNARAASEAAPAVAAIIAAELDRDDAWTRAQVEEFRRLAEGYLSVSL